MHIREFKRRTPNIFDEYKGVKIGDKLHLRHLPKQELVCMAFYRGRYNKVYVAYNDEPHRPNKVCGAWYASDCLEFAPNG